MLNNLKILLDKDYTPVKKATYYQLLDILFNMIIYTILFLTIYSLIEKSFTMNKIYWYSGLLLIALIFKSYFGGWAMVKMQKTGSTASKDLRIAMGDHVKKLNLGYFNSHNLGYLINILTMDITDFEQAVTHNIPDLLKVLVLSVYLLLITFFINFKLAIIQIVVVLLTIPILKVGGEKLEKIGVEKKNVSAKLISTIIEYISGIEVFKSFGVIGDKFERLEKGFRDLKKYSIKLELTAVPYVLLFQVIIDLLFPILLLLAVRFFMNGELEAKMLVGFIVLSLTLTNVIRNFSASYSVTRYLFVSVAKISDTLNYPTISYKDEDFNFSGYDISFENVDFSYTEDRKVLKDINFIAKNNEITALVGKSGSGKSTIMSLIARFWDTTKGSIKIGGKDIKEVNPDSLLKNISMVFQDVYLINDTIYENIRIGNLNASREEVMNAAKIANCHGFISKLPNGYDTYIGEEGSTLSGGEKQRISIARALLKNSPIILLDEATASLDADSEHEIKMAINELIKDKTVIIIAHRLNTIKDANNIIVMDDGKIIESGNHEKLMNDRGAYYSMFTAMEKAKEFSI